MFGPLIQRVCHICILSNISSISGVWFYIFEYICKFHIFLVVFFKLCCSSFLEQHNCLNRYRLKSEIISNFTNIIKYFTDQWHSVTLQEFQLCPLFLRTFTLTECFMNVIFSFFYCFLLSFAASFFCLFSSTLIGSSLSISSNIS